MKIVRKNEYIEHADDRQVLLRKLTHGWLLKVASSQDEIWLFLLYEDSPSFVQPSDPLCAIHSTSGQHIGVVVARYMWLAMESQDSTLKKFVIV